MAEIVLFMMKLSTSTTKNSHQNILNIKYTLLLLDELTSNKLTVAYS